MSLVIPKSKTGLRRYFGTGVTIVIALALTYCFLVAPGERTFSSLASNIVLEILATLTAGLILTAAMLYWFPRETSGIEELSPKNRQKRLDEELKTAETWLYSGNTASWNRVKTLPQLAKKSRDLNTEHEITLIILNPLNSEACDQYAEYRNKVRSGKVTGFQWDGLAVRNQLLATILLCAKYAIEEPSLTVNLFLRNWFKSIRFDFSQSVLLITREDSNEPAIEIVKDAVFYRGFSQELREEQRQCKRVVLPEKGAYDWDDSNIEATLKRMGFENLDPSQPRQIRKILTDAKDPYE